MKFSESIVLRLPKREIQRQEYEIFARSRPGSHGNIEYTGYINEEALGRAPDILQQLGFVVMRNALTSTAIAAARSANLGNKQTVSALGQAWNRAGGPQNNPAGPAMSVIHNESGGGVRFNQPGFHMVTPSEGWQNVYITQPRQAAQTRLLPGDVLAWEQGDGFFPCVELANTCRTFIASYVLHESVTYTNQPVAPEG